MVYLLASIVFSVTLLVNFRLYPKYRISTLQAIVFNYPVCFLTGLLMMGDTTQFTLDLSQNWTWYCLALGMGFIITFILSGFSTLKVGMTITSLANNISLVIPVLFSLWVFGSDTVNFGFINYIGLVAAFIAVGIATFKPDGNKISQGWQGGWLAIGVFLGYGITNTAINYVQIHIIKDASGVIPVTLVMVLGAIITGFVVLLYKQVKKEEVFSPRNILAGVFLGIPNFLSFYFLVQALNHFGSSGAFVYLLYNLGVILLSSVVGVLAFKEKLSALNKVGLGLALLAIIFVSWNALFV